MEGDFGDVGDQESPCCWFQSHCASVATHDATDSDDGEKGSGSIPSSFQDVSVGTHDCDSGDDGIRTFDGIQISGTATSKSGTHDAVNDDDAI